MNITIEENCIYKPLAEVSKAQTVVIISDSNVASLYGQDFLKALKVSNKYLLTFPAGESHKTRAIKLKLEDQMLALGCNRNTLVIAFGGGVVLDLAGFVAATFCRGVNCIYIPTTLLAMVDACIGGKTGVNTEYGKNLIGVIREPCAIYIDPILLKTLPEREMLCGKVETIKHALLCDQSLLASIKTMSIKSLIERSIAIKTSIVKQDLHEGGIRKILNLGHTLAHALETASDYVLNHGEAVAYGIIGEAYIANRLAILNDNDFAVIKSQFAPLPLPPLVNLDQTRLLAALTHDKKNQFDEVHCVLMAGINEIYQSDSDYSTPIPQELFIDALHYLK